jgi:serine/threonine-protein kinase
VTALPAAGGGSRGLLLGAGAALAMVVGGVAAYRFMKPPETPSRPAAVTTAPSATAPPAPAPEAKPRTVQVVVLPEGATVEVDGAAVVPNDGTVEITGTLASVHKVRVKSEGGEVLRNVVITDNGAIPAKVEAPAAPASAQKPAAVKPPGLKPTGAPGTLQLRQER